MDNKQHGLSDFAVQWIAESFAFGCLCLATAWSDAWFMWGVILVWAFFLGPTKEKNRSKQPKETEQKTPEKPRHTENVSDQGSGGESRHTALPDGKNRQPEGLNAMNPIEMYRNVSQTQLSVARFYGCAKVNGSSYTYMPDTDCLIRDDILRKDKAKIKVHEANERKKKRALHERLKKEEEAKQNWMEF